MRRSFLHNPGALAKIFDGLGGFLAVVIAAAGDAADAELGGGGVVARAE